MDFCGICRKIEQSLCTIPIFSLTLGNSYVQYSQQVSDKSLALDRVLYHRDRLFKAIWDDRSRTLIGYVESIHSKFPPLRAFPPPLLLVFSPQRGPFSVADSGKGCEFPAVLTRYQLNLSRKPLFITPQKKRRPLINSQYLKKVGVPSEAFFVMI